MSQELILSRDAYLLTMDLRLFFLVASAYGFSSIVFILYIITRTPGVGRAGKALMSGGVVLHVGLLAFRTFEGGRAPFQSLYESLSWFACSTSLTYLVVSRRFRETYPPALFVTLLAAGASFYALLARSPAISPLSPPLQSRWFEWHVILAFLSYAVIAVSCAIEGTYLIVNPFLKRGRAELFGLTASNTDDFRKTAYNLVLFGFPLLTFALFSGAAWANEAWGRYWSWDPKETWSLITWSVFTMYLHSMSIKSWRGNTSSWLNIAGFVCMMMTFLGVNWLAKLLGIPGLHLYAV
ncbi:MAG: c-type cytochrome biogenesis protein CcsB [Deltaproteobacteria bacterium]|nr:c-type cytochrome biogenesis protein CcsB [Deltaproteobacteria bacterium]